MGRLVLRSSASQGGGGGGVAVDFRLDFSSLQPNASGYPQYNAGAWESYGNTANDGQVRWVAEHEATGGPGGTPCVHVTHKAGFEQITTGYTKNLGSRTYTLGQSRFVRMILRFDDSFRAHQASGSLYGNMGQMKFVQWGSNNGRCIIYRMSPNDAGPNFALDRQIGGTPISYAIPSYFGLSVSPDRFSNDSQLGADYISLGPSNGITSGADNACPPVCLYRGGLSSNQARPGPSGKGALPSNGWYYIQYECKTGTNLSQPGGASYKTWVNTNDYANPTAYAGDSWASQATLTVEDWSGGSPGLNFFHYVDESPTIDLGFRCAGFEIGPEYDPNWYPG